VARRLQRCIAIAVIGAACSFDAAADTDVSPRNELPWRVLILQGYDPWLASAVQFEQTLRPTLYANVPRFVDVYTETLDSGRFRSSDLEATFLALLRQKYSHDRPDLIIAGAPFALDFALRHRAELWPDAPIVFFGVSPRAWAGRPRPANVTGQLLDYDPSKTLALALRLSPHAASITLIAGVTEADKLRMQATLAAAAKLAPRLEIARLDNLPFGEMARRVATLPRDSVVLFLGLYRDARGDTYVPVHALEQLSGVSSAPVYGWASGQLGHGIVGGALTDFEEEGRAVGQLAADVLTGRVSASAPIRDPLPPGCAVDARQLERWDLSERNLPTGCTIAFRIPTLWQTYRWEAVTAVVLIVLQAGLIAGMLFQRRQRRRATLEVQRMRSELSHASRLATVGELTAAISHEINQPLGAVQSNADAAEMFLDANPPRLDRVREVIAEIRAANARSAEVVRRLRTLLKKNQLTFQTLDVNEVVDTVLQLVATEAHRRGVTLRADLQDGPLRIEGDPIQLQQVVLNLLMNAMDAMAEVPAVRRHARIRTSANRDSVSIHVSDRGQGVAPGDMSRLFQSFFTTKAQGLGIGLSVARTIVTAHGGRIRVENNSDGGATFEVVIPKGRTHGEVVSEHASNTSASEIAK
jgi:signal transduction histidine kinase